MSRHRGRDGFSSDRYKEIVMSIPAIHPGEHLAEELKELDMSAASLARQIEVSPTRITESSTGDVQSLAIPPCD